MRDSGITTLSTSRLLLRAWTEADLEPFAALNADPETMALMPATLTRDESDALVERILDHFADRGCGLWAVEVRATGAFVGFVGLAVPTFEAHFTPAVEVGWRLARSAWGHGYATEGARAAVAYGFDEVGLDEVVSFTSEGHVASRAVMERLGMAHDPADDFDHPHLPHGHPLRRHVLYRLRRPEAA